MTIDEVQDRTGGAVPAGVNAGAEDDGSYGDCTVDGSHPNDLGFYRMARHIGDVLARCLGTA